MSEAWINTRALSGPLVHLLFNANAAAIYIDRVVDAPDLLSMLRSLSSISTGEAVSAWTFPT